MDMKIVVQMDNQTTADYQLVSFFEFIESKKRYIIFTKNEIVNDTLINLYISEVVDEGGKFRLINSMNADDWNAIRSVMTNIITSKPIDNIKCVSGVSTFLSTDNLNARKIAVTDPQSKALINFYANATKEAVVQANPVATPQETQQSIVQATPVVNSNTPVLENVETPVSNNQPVVEQPAEVQSTPVVESVVSNTGAPATEPVVDVASNSVVTVEHSDAQPINSGFELPPETSNPVMPAAPEVAINTAPNVPVSESVITPVTPSVPNAETSSEIQQPIPTNETSVAPTPEVDTSFKIPKNEFGGSGIKVDDSVKVNEATTNEELDKKIKMAYIVENGDTIESICKKFGYNVPNFLAHNKLAITATIMAGMILFFPENDNMFTTADEINYEKLNKKLLRIAKNGGQANNDPLSGLNNSGELEVKSTNIFG